MPSHLTAGVMAGIAGLFVFLVIHHFWITPIWFILPAGLLIATLGGALVGWSFDHIRAGLPGRPLTSLAMMALIGAILAPSLILAELRDPLVDVTTMAIIPQGGRVVFLFVTELLLTSAFVGALAGWLLGRTPQAAFTTALAGIMFALGPGHNIPLLGSTSAAGKGWVLLLAITLVSSVVLVELDAWLRHG